MVKVEKRKIVPNKVSGITPQMNSAKFAALEMINQHRNVMNRPTSSKIGNFLSYDKPASVEGDNFTKAYQNVLI